jgi:steroid delta-isomerase-like uncharacterized protein
MTEKELREAIQNAFAALNARDLDTYCSFLHDDYVWDNDAFPTPIHGKEAVCQGFAQYFAAFPDLKVELGEIICNSSGDSVVNCWTATGTHQGHFRDIAPTERTIEMRGCTVSKMRDGLVLSSTTYTDNLAVVRQMTEVPKAAGAD